MADHKGVRSDKCSISLAKKKALSAIQRGKSAINRLQTMGAARRANKKKGFREHPISCLSTPDFIDNRGSKNINTAIPDFPSLATQKH